MGKRLTKKQKAQRSKKKAQKKVSKLEREDSLGINRKELRFGLNPKIWVTLKIISIVSIPVAYVLYSPLLIVTMVFAISLMVFATMAERNINHTYVKSRHIKIYKFDSILAILVILITIASTLISANTKMKMPFPMMKNSIWRSIESFGSCATGSRSVIQRFAMKLKAPSFGGANPPPGMPKPGQRKQLSISDLPIEMVFSMAISSVNTILVFLVPVSSAITLFLYSKRKKKFDFDMNEIVPDELPNLEDERFKDLFLFGLEPINEEIPLIDVEKIE